MVVLQQLPSQCWVELILQQLIALQEELITCHECLAVCLLTHSVLCPFSTVAALPWFIFCFHPALSLICSLIMVCALRDFNIHWAELNSLALCPSVSFKKFWLLFVFISSFL